MQPPGRISADFLVAVVQWRASEIVVDFRNASQQLKEQLALFACQRCHNAVLNGIDSGLSILQKLSACISEVEQFLALVLGVRHTPYQVPTFKSLKHIANRCSIESDQRRETGSISRLLGFDRRQCCVLNGREIELRTFIQKNCP
jgi:hypothetical protein